MAPTALRSFGRGGSLAGFNLPTAAFMAALVVGAATIGWAALGLVFIVVLGVIYGFDAVIICSEMLASLPEGWRRLFLTAGVFITLAVQAALPVLLIVLADHLGYGRVIHEALFDDQAFRADFEGADVIIVAIIAPYIQLAFLDWLFNRDKVRHWKVPGIYWVESRAQAATDWLSRKLCRLPGIIEEKIIPYCILGAQVLVIWLFVGGGSWLVFTTISAVVYFVTQVLAVVLEKKGSGQVKGFGPSLGLWLRLELSFAMLSLDAASGAFAVSSNFKVIVLGLVVTGLYIRTCTGMAADHDINARVKYADHGAMWALAPLPIYVFLKLFFPLPDWLLGLVSTTAIVAAVMTSLWQSGRQSSPRVQTA